MHPQHIASLEMANSCSCAPTTHKGSFRCGLHRGAQVSNGESLSTKTHSQASSAAAINPCICSPTSHPGSFRCNLHRSKGDTWEGHPLQPSARAKSSSRNSVKAADHIHGSKEIQALELRRLGMHIAAVTCTWI